MDGSSWFIKHQGFQLVLYLRKCLYVEIMKKLVRTFISTIGKAGNWELEACFREEERVQTSWMQGQPITNRTQWHHVVLWLASKPTFEAQQDKIQMYIKSFRLLLNKSFSNKLAAVFVTHDCYMFLTVKDKTNQWPSWCKAKHLPLLPPCDPVYTIIRHRWGSVYPAQQV